MKPFLFITALCGICSGHVLTVNPKRQVETLAAPDFNNTQPVERQASCTWVATFDKNYPNPDPHQIYLHKQLSEPITGGAVSVESSVTFTVGFSASGGDGKGFFGGGFDVSESVTTGFSDGCEAENGAETVCLWKRIAHTRYTVQPGIVPHCITNGQFEPVGDPYQQTSPNDRNEGGEFYCVRGRQYCRTIGDEYWEGPTCAGGPQGYCPDSK